MHRLEPDGPLRRREITREEVEQGIARARHLRARAFANVASTLSRKVAAVLRKVHRPNLSPTEPNNYFPR